MTTIRLQPGDLRALMASLVWANAEHNAGVEGVVRETDELLAELHRTAQPEPSVRHPLVFHDSEAMRLVIARAEKAEARLAQIDAAAAKLPEMPLVEGMAADDVIRAYEGDASIFRCALAAAIQERDAAQAEAEGLRLELAALQEEVMVYRNREGELPKPVEFQECDGIMRRLIWEAASDNGEAPAGYIPDDNAWEDHEAAARRQGAEEERERTLALLGNIINVRQENTPEWMEWMAEEVNATYEAIGEADRVRFNGDCLIRVRAALAPTEKEEK